MSEAELHVIKARLQGGIRNKARRGELPMSLPIGFVYRNDGIITLDPDKQIQQAIRLLFDTFKNTGSAMSVVKYFKKENWKFPRRIRKGIGKGNVIWGSILHSRVIQILHNPRYAGAFVYGRTKSGRTADLRPVQIRLPREQWLVLIQEAHIGYINWETYEKNQETLRKNAAGFGNGNRGSVPREGTGLLQGRVICGLCGSRMRVRYQKISDHMEPYYQCNNESIRQSGKLCQSIRGSGIDEAISSLLLDTVSPVACEVALAVQDEITQQIEKSNQVRETQLERARYDAELARRRYMQVDPDFRLVADTLEAEWNEKLRLLDDLQQSCEQHRIADSLILTDEVRKQIMELTNHFSRVWSDPGVKPIDKKHIVALLIEDVTITKGQDKKC